jgi:isochorismate hydrolase
MKKSNYFTEKNITEISKSFLGTIIDLRKKHNNNFDISHSALLVSDMQNYFLDKNSHAFIPSASAIIKNIKLLINFMNAHNRPVIFTRHINNENNSKNMGRWWKDIIKKDDNFSEIIPNLNAYANIIIEKTQYDSFYKTDLEEILKRNNVKQLVITGVMTHLCCETTSRSGFVRGYEIFFIIDGTATYNEEFHRATLLNLSHGFALPVLTTEIISSVKKTYEKNE